MLDVLMKNHIVIVLGQPRALNIVNFRVILVSDHNFSKFTQPRQCNVVKISTDSWEKAEEKG